MIKGNDPVLIGTEVMAEHGLEPAFAAAVRVQEQLAKITAPGSDADPRIRDLAALPWCLIDNDDSLDLDQLVCSGQTSTVESDRR